MKTSKFILEVKAGEVDVCEMHHVGIVCVMCDGLAFNSNEEAMKKVLGMHTLIKVATQPYDDEYDVHFTFSDEDNPNQRTQPYKKKVTGITINRTDKAIEKRKGKRWLASITIKEK